MLLSACIVDTPSETAASNMEFSGLELGMSILSSCPGTRGFHWLGQQVPDAMLG